MKVRAYSNIALAKYWGKKDIEQNVPATPSLSMTLDALYTETEVVFDEELTNDVLLIDGKEASTSRASKVLKRIREVAGISAKAKISTTNNFPTASGLASSASGFAALVGAACHAANLSWSEEKMAEESRRASASAARSIAGGFVSLDIHGVAEQIAKPDHWDVCMVVGIATFEEKEVGSTEGMERSRITSPLYDHWVRDSLALHEQVKSGLLEKDLQKLGEAMEQSTTYFHACVMSSLPPIFYWSASTMKMLHAIHDARKKGLAVYATMDAGPHLKALCLKSDADEVERILKESGGATKTIVAGCAPGLVLV